MFGVRLTPGTAFGVIVGRATAMLLADVGWSVMCRSGGREGRVSCRHCSSTQTYSAS